MHKKNMYKAIVAIAVALAFILPTSAAFANVGTIGVTSNGDDNTLPTLGTIYVDDDFDASTPGWGVTHFDNIQDGVTNAIAGDTVYVYNGIYYELVSVTKQLDLVGESKENVIIDGTGLEWSVLTITATSYVSIDKFTIINSDWMGGIDIIDSSYNTITNCDMYGSYEGIYLYNSSNNTITNCNMHDNQNNGIDNREFSNNNVFTDCNMYNNDDKGFYIKESSYTEITNCDSYNNADEGFYIYKALNTNVTDCDAYNNEDEGFEIYYSSNTIVTDCDVLNPGDEGIYIYYSSNNNIINCNVSASGDEGIYFKGSSSDPATNNVVTDCNVYNSKYGIYLYYYVSNNDIINCNVYGNSEDGIYIKGTSSTNPTSNNNITSCDIYDNSNDGIYVYQCSSYNRITDCNIYNNQYGIELYTAYSTKPINYNEITYCKIHDNSARGIYIKGHADYNLMHHNCFVDNTGQNAYDACTNTWDNGSAGNYWDDYTGVDADYNGFGDTPYGIWGLAGNQDNYPFMYCPLGDTIVRFDPPSQIVERGETFTVSYYVEPTDWVAGAFFETITFDPTLLQANGPATKGGFFKGKEQAFDGGIVDNVAGTIKDGLAAVTSANAVYEPGAVYVFSFTALDKLGTSDLVMSGLVGFMIAGKDPGQYLEYTLESGSVTVADFFDLTISVDGSGTTDPLPGVYRYQSGKLVDLTATADLGWTFDSWTGPDAGEISGNQITMTKDMFITAYFTEDQYTLDITIVGSGTVTKDPDYATYTYNTVVTLTPNPVIGWTFIGWTGPDAGYIVSDQITMTKNMAVTATFTEDQYTLDITIVGSGTVTKAPDQSTYIYNTVVTLTPNPVIGWTFIGWSGPDGNLVVANQITMTKNMAVTATFTEDEYILTVDISGLGSVGIVPDKAFYLYGETVTLTVTPNTGWEFEGWSGPDVGDLVPDTDSWTIFMDDNKDVTATFKQIGWDAELTISGTVSFAIEDTVVFGEKALASNDIDIYDLPKSPTPPNPPYVYAWFNTSLTVPYDILWEDYRHLLDENTWNLKIITDGNLGRVKITITWNLANVGMSGYDYVGLYDMLTGNCVADMTDVNTYEYWADNGMEYWFQIRGRMNHPPVANDDDDYKTNENTVLTVDAPGVLANDEDDGTFGVISVDTTLTQGSILDWDYYGMFVYKPPVGVSGFTDEFDYTISDGTYSDTATVSIEVVTLNRISIEDGWNLFSIPIGADIDKTTIIVEYSGTWHTWAEALSDDVILKFTYGWQASGYTDGKGNTLVPGEGYWMWAFEDCNLLIPSNDPTDNHITYLDVGWNLVGVHEDDLLKTDLRLQYDGQYRLWTYAVTHGVILDFVYDWDRANQNYALALNDIFVSGYGYWVYAYQGCALKEPL